jgi:hypothetical protein
LLTPHVLLVELVNIPQGLTCQTVLTSQLPEPETLATPVDHPIGQPQES